MAASLNQMQLIGNLGKDPETRALNDGSTVVNFSVATSESWKDKDGNKQEKTEWHNVSAFGKLADIIAQYLHKGSKVFIQGKLTTRKWEKDGQAHYTTSITAKDLVMLSGPNTGQQHGGGNDAPDLYAGQNNPAPGDEDLPF